MKTKRPMIQICFSPVWGGLEMSSVRWAKYFKDRGYHSILLTSHGARSAEQAKEWGIEVLQWDLPRDYLSLKTRKNLHSLIRDVQPAAFFNHLTRDLWHLSPVLRKYPEIQLFNFSRMFIRGIKKKDFLHRRIYSRVDKMIALTQIQKSFLLEALPVSDERFVVIPNAVDTEKFQARQRSAELRAELGAPDRDQILVGLIGRMDPMKGHAEFVEAAQLIASKHSHVQFVMVGAATIGEGDEYSQKVLQQIENSGMSSRIKLLPNRSDIPKIMNCLDVFCMPSYEEAFGNVLLEAMASEVACVSTNAGGVPEIITEGHNGILVSPRSGRALAGGLLRLIEDAELRQFIAKNGRASVLDRYTIEAVFSQVESLLR